VYKIKKKKYLGVPGKPDNTLKHISNSV